MKAIAQINYSRISPKKMKIWGRNIVGLSPQIAIDRLDVTNNKAARILQKAVISATANAKNNLNLNATKMRIISVETLQGPFYKRWQPVSRGMAHQIKKRTTHIRVTLDEIVDTKEQKQLVSKKVNINKNKNGDKTIEGSKSGTKS